MSFVSTLTTPKLILEKKIIDKTQVKTNDNRKKPLSMGPLTVKYVDNKAIVSWDPVEGATSYDIYCGVENFCKPLTYQTSLLFQEIKFFSIGTTRYEMTAGYGPDTFVIIFPNGGGNCNKKDLRVINKNF